MSELLLIERVVTLLGASIVIQDLVSERAAEVEVPDPLALAARLESVERTCARRIECIASPSTPGRCLLTITDERV